jgi:acyl carrier protein
MVAWFLPCLQMLLVVLAWFHSTLQDLSANVPTPLLLCGLCRFMARLPAVPDFLNEFAPTAAAAAAARPGARPAAAAAAVTGISLAGIASEVSSAVAAVVGRQLEQESSLMESGLDSLGAVELRNSLAASFDMELPATLVRRYCCFEAQWGIHNQHYIAVYHPAGNASDLYLGLQHGT